MRNFFFIILMLCIHSANSQDNIIQVPVIDNVASKLNEETNDQNIGLTLISIGDDYYQNKHYDDAIEQYISSLKYLSAPEKVIQEKLAETNKKIAQSYKRLKNKEKTAFFYKKTLSIYSALQDKKNMAHTLNTLAEAERHLENHVLALDYSIRSLEIHKQIDDPAGYAKSSMGAGINYRHIGHYEKSLKHIYDAYLYYKKVNDISGIAKSSNQMGLIYTRLKQFDQARSFYQLTIDLPVTKIQPKTLASALREMAVIELNSGDYQSAKVLAQKARNIYKSQNNKLKESITARITANIYRAQDDEKNAISYYKESLALATEVGSKLYQIKAQTPLGAFLMDKNSDEAISLLKKALQLSIEINNKPQQLYANRELRKAEKALGHFVESLRHAEREIDLTKIIFNKREENQLVIAKVNLHSHKIEMELESLREKTKLDQLELSKKNNEIEIAGQARLITELKLTKNRYANFALACSLVICLFAVLCLYRRFIDSRKRNKELDYLAARDPLTNCYNRRTLFNLMNRDFSDLILLREYCIIMVDVDHFKEVNDRHGHNAGDAVLSNVGKILQACVRHNDIVTRFGGEEFCVVLPGAAQDLVMGIAEAMRKKVEASRSGDIAVTCSFGVTSIKFNAKSPIELINQADLALYKSKSNGRNKVTLWDKTLEE